MNKRYDLLFNIGAVKCKLISVQPQLNFQDGYASYYVHNHSYFELHYIEDAPCKLYSNHNCTEIEPGHVLIIPPRLYHRMAYDLKTSTHMSMTFDISTPDTNYTSNDLLFYKSFPENSATILYANEDLKEILVKLKALSQNSEKEYLTREKMRVLCNSLFIELFELLCSNKTVETSTSKISDEDIIDSFFAFEFMSNSANKDLADKLHVSTRQLHRMIKKKYNLNYRQKLNEIRLEIATNFLLNTDKSITEISELLGYSSGANFTTFIKKSTGLTPTQIRKNPIN